MELDNNTYLKERIALLENGDSSCYLETNDIGGVDYKLGIEISKLGIDLPEDEIRQSLEEYFDGLSIFYNKDEISISTADDIFINHKNKIVFPERNIVEISFFDDFHAWLLIEEWMEEKGEFPGVWKHDYYGNVSAYSFDGTYRNLFPEEGKSKLKKIGKYLKFFQIREELDNGYSWDIANLSDELLGLFPKGIRDSSEAMYIETVEEIIFGKVILHINTGELELSGYKLVGAPSYGNIYQIDLTTESNPIRFIFEGA